MQKANKRRRLSDGLDKIAKAIFGTVGANNEKLINKQLSLLHNANVVVQHSMAKPIQVN